MTLLEQLLHLYGHSATVVGQQIIIVGGIDLMEKQTRALVNVLNVETTPTWSKPEIVDRIPARSYHHAALNLAMRQLSEMKPLSWLLPTKS